MYARAVTAEWTRRRALQALALGTASGSLPHAASAHRLRQGGAAAPAVIHTVTGPIAADALGLTLSHEHLFSRFGDPPDDAPAYPARLADTVLPYLRYLHALGVRTIVDATAAWFGRAPRLLQQLSQESGVQILTNTGLYGAADDRYVPEAARTASADDLARQWTREHVNGIGDTGIRPGFIKIGVDAGPLSPIDRTLVVAAARTHLQTGLTIACHTGNSAGAAMTQLDILRAERVAPGAWVWVHAHSCTDDDALWRAAAAGAWLGLDGITALTWERHIALVVEARRRRLLARILLSHDGNAFPAGGRLPRDFHLLLTSFRYRLADHGLTSDDIDQLLVANPRAAWGGGVRRQA